MEEKYGKSKWRENKREIDREERNKRRKLWKNKRG